MINLDEIQVRLDRGEVSAADAQLLADEADNLKLKLDAVVIDRLSRGLMSVQDAQYIFMAVEDEYSTQYHRPTHAAQIAADKAKTDSIAAKADADRAAAAVASAQKDAADQAARAAIAAKVAADAQAAADQKKAQEQFAANQKVSDAILAEKKTLAQKLKDALNG
jgi:hypothetical protein